MHLRQVSCSNLSRQRSPIHAVLTVMGGGSNALQGIGLIFETEHGAHQAHTSVYGIG